MADQKPNTSLTAVLERAIDEASAHRAPAVEAEHLLLALASDESLTAARVLAEAGLDRDAIDAALSQERAQSLTAVGIGAIDGERLVATPRQGRPGWGTSTKEAITRGHKLGSQDGRRLPAETELLVGILQPSLGTVPRMLTIAGVDRRDLIERARLAR